MQFTSQCSSNSQNTTKQKETGSYTDAGDQLPTTRGQYDAKKLNETLFVLHTAKFHQAPFQTASIYFYRFIILPQMAYIYFFT